MSVIDHFIGCLIANFITADWFYCHTCLHDWADCAKHHVLLWSLFQLHRVVLNWYLVGAETFTRHLSDQLRANIASKSGPASWTACRNWFCLQRHSRTATQSENLPPQTVILQVIFNSYQEVIVSLKIFFFSSFLLFTKSGGGREVWGTKGIDIARPVWKTR